MWFKVDDNLAFNAKVVTAGNEAIGLWVRAGSWASSQLTDGFVPTAIALAMAAPMAPAIDVPMADPMAPIRALLQAGLWVEEEGGYQFHDWSDYQPSAEDEKKKRKAKSDAGRKGAEVRWAGKSDGTSDGTCHSTSYGTSDGKPMPRPVPSRPSINAHEQTSLVSVDAIEDEFAEWWAAYPRKKDKKPAEKAYKAARKRASADTLLAGAEAYAAEVRGRDITKVKLGATWLNGDCWENEPESNPPDEFGDRWERRPTSNPNLDHLPEDIRIAQAALKARHR